MDKEIKNILKKGVIKEANTEIEGEQLSSVFRDQKPNGTFRMTLNLKKLNECVEAPHFNLLKI